VVDDHEMVRRGVARTLAFDPKVEVVGEAQDGLEAIEVVRRLRPAVALMDVNMPKLDGIEATRRLTEAMPALRIIGLSMHQDPEVESRMRSAGACDYVTKDAPSETLRAAVHQSVDDSAPDSGEAPGPPT
ncbi:response regulator transcription factor, partial [Alienimonas sp. DA493]|uniref:response regulator n=1 Tax=Alienimonas sp. DA493 TaxID=3373605 RepID=UPI00375495E4